MAACVTPSLSMALGLRPALLAESGLKPAVPAASPSKPSVSFKLPRQTLTRQPIGLGGHCSGIHTIPSREETPPPPPHCGALEAETPHSSPEGGPPCLHHRGDPEPPSPALSWEGLALPSSLVLAVSTVNHIPNTGQKVAEGGNSSWLPEAFRGRRRASSFQGRVILAERARQSKRQGVCLRTAGFGTTVQML